MYSEWQPNYALIRERCPVIEFDKGWRDKIFYSINPEKRNILIFDDQMGVASSCTSVADLFTKGSHNRNITVIYLVQNVYYHGNSQRTISLHSHYSVNFLNGRDASQFRIMTYQICPSDGKWLVDSFMDATSKPYGYLVRDQNPLKPENQTVVTNILP